MESLQYFNDLLTDLERIQAVMADMSKRTDDGWKREFIEMRRQLQTQLTAVAAAADDCPQIKNRPEATARLRESWTKMRSNLALHQANWPAVKIDRENPDYVKSVQIARATNKAFIDLAREIVGEIRRAPSVTRASGYLDPKSVGL